MEGFSTHENCLFAPRGQRRSGTACTSAQCIHVLLSVCYIWQYTTFFSLQRKSWSDSNKQADLGLPATYDVGEVVLRIFNDGILFFFIFYLFIFFFEEKCQSLFSWNNNNNNNNNKKKTNNNIILSCSEFGLNMKRLTHCTLKTLSG